MTILIYDDDALTAGHKDACLYRRDDENSFEMFTLGRQTKSSADTRTDTVCVCYVRFLIGMIYTTDDEIIELLNNNSFKLFIFFSTRFIVKLIAPHMGNLMITDDY